MQPTPNQRICSNCKGASAATALSCQWCGTRLPRIRSRSRSPIWILAMVGAIVFFFIFTCSVLFALIQSSPRPVPTAPPAQPQYLPGSPTVRRTSLPATIGVATRQSQAVQQSAQGTTTASTAIAQAVIAEQSTAIAVAAGSTETALVAIGQATAIAQAMALEP